jgi:transposase
MGTRQSQEKQEEIWIGNVELARSPGHPFYRHLNKVLDEEKFDAFAESLCRKFYAPRMGRPSLVLGVYFRSLLIGYFEGIDSERGIAWRLADSLALREFPPQQAKTACRGPRSLRASGSRSRRRISRRYRAPGGRWM